MAAAAHVCRVSVAPCHTKSPIATAGAAGRPASCVRAAHHSSNSSSSATTTHPQQQQQQQQQQQCCVEQHQHQHHHQHQQPQHRSRRHRPLQQPAAVAAAVLAAAAVVQPDAASALTIHAEPSNALSLPTWAIHVSSVTEWIAAMALFWKYAEVTGNQRWKGMTWGMMPSLGSAMAACTWHFFYNSPDLDFLVALQAFLTVVGNCTCWWAAYRIYTAAQAEQPSS